jgi:hypothetical protein
MAISNAYSNMLNNILIDGNRAVYALINQVIVSPQAFSMLTALTAETTCVFPAGAASPIKVVLNKRVNLTNFSASGVAFQTTMYMIPVAGQPLQFRLSLVENGAAVAVGGVLPVSARIQATSYGEFGVITPLNVLVSDEVSYTGYTRQSKTVGYSELVSNEYIASAEPALFTNSTGATVVVSAALVLIGGSTTLGTFTCSYHSYQEPYSIITLLNGQTLGVNFTQRLTSN